MKSMIKRTTIREIKHSFGRYFAILAIVALGVGFFAGLKVTKKAMTVSANQYLSEGQLYDLRLLSTLGFENQDVEALKEKDDVRSVEGAVFADIIIVHDKGNDTVIKAHSLTENINQVVLVSGRMPKQPDECVVDSNLFKEDAIGTTITLSQSNSEEDLENFSFHNYKITGIVQSPYYVQFERGNTSIGNGMISGFIYLLRDGFQMDYNTEIYVKFNEDFPIYSDAYKEYIEDREETWKTYCEEQAERRYQSILQDANEEYSEAEAKLETEKIKALKELSDAEKKLQDAETEIKIGEKQLSDAEKEIAENDAAIQLKEKELISAQIALSQNQIDTGKSAIEDAKKQLKAATTVLDQKKKEIEEAKVKLADGKQEYEEANQEFQKQIKDAENQLSDAKKEIEKLQKPDTYVLGRDTNVGYVCFENDSNIVDGIANVFPVFFFLVAALVCMTTMNRMVDEQRTQIGVLKALGYSEFVIMSKYLFYSGSAAVLGGISGYFLGTYFFPLVIWNTYGIMYDMGKFSYVFDCKLAIISLAVAILCSMGTTWFSCRYVLLEVAAGLMRPKAPKSGKRVFLEYVPFLWNRLKFLQKVSVRNIVRYKKRFFMMILGISGCTALLVTGFGIKDSIADVAMQQFQEIEVYDISVTLQDGIYNMQDTDSDTIIDALDSHHSNYLFAQQNTMDLVSDGKIKSVNIIMVQNPDQVGSFLDLHTSKGEPITYPKVGETVICNKIADTFHLEIGDEIILRTNTMKELKATVSGICENYVYNYIYISPLTYRDQIGEPSYKTIYVTLSEEEDAHAVAAKLMKQDQVTGATVISDMMERFSSMMDSLDYIVLVVLFCAAALAFIVLYNLNNINITERVREIATIKVLGFYKKETASYVFRENMVLTGIGCGLGLLLGKLLHSYVMNEINIDVVSFDIHINGISYLCSIGLTFAFAWIVNRFMSGKLDRINMAESLKSVD
ncbi:MAG TPA: FtsX-like permease family protein [Lachnospiraceae bacterium]|nr:FtsX-like permease family protein [Lachnospiraceae bacterium]